MSRQANLLWISRELYSMLFVNSTQYATESATYFILFIEIFTLYQTTYVYTYNGGIIPF